MIWYFKKKLSIRVRVALETKENGVIKANVGWVYVIAAWEKGAHSVFQKVQSYLFIDSLNFIEYLFTRLGIILHAGNMEINKSKSSWSLHSSGEGSQYILSLSLSIHTLFL